MKYGHAVPTTRSCRGGRSSVPRPRRPIGAHRLLSMISALTGRDLLIVLLSGGASSLMPAPVRGVSLRDKQRKPANCFGAEPALAKSIASANISRISRAAAWPPSPRRDRHADSFGRLGDDLSVIASGPTAPDPTTYHDAVRLPEAVPSMVLGSRRGSAPSGTRPAGRVSGDPEARRCALSKGPS